MSTKKQILTSVILLVLAGGAVGIYTVQAAPAEQSGGMEGHNHAAMGGGGEGDQLNPVQLTESAARSIGVTYATVGRRTIDREVRTVGTVEYDETRLANLNPKIEGWVERLYVDFTGAPVRKGQPLLELYSPMLVTAQEELILARRLLDEATGERAERNARTLLESSRRRLAYWDIPAGQIERIEESGQPTKTLTLRAPASGIVVEKNVVEGGRIMPGMDVFKIADLSTVWVEGEVFEKDLSLATGGQTAEVTFESYPGEVFTGTIAYVYPSVSTSSRTGRVRIELSNPGIRLRPGMYANIRLAVQGLAEGLVIPRSAVLFTGERAIVFVRHDNNVLMPHEVTTGLVAGNEIEILAGVEEGQQVVTSASFLIDAESNLGASMGAMDAGDAGTAGSPEIDHSQHGSPAPAVDPSEKDAGAPAVDHSGHTPGMDMEQIRIPQQDDHSGHSGHE